MVGSPVSFLPHRPPSPRVCLVCRPAVGFQAGWRTWRVARGEKVVEDRRKKKTSPPSRTAGRPGPLGEAPWRRTPSPRPSSRTPSRCAAPTGPPRPRPRRVPPPRARLLPHRAEALPPGGTRRGRGRGRGQRGAAPAPFYGVGRPSGGPKPPTPAPPPREGAGPLRSALRRTRWMDGSCGGGGARAGSRRRLTARGIDPGPGTVHAGRGDGDGAEEPVLPVRAGRWGGGPGGGGPAGPGGPGRAVGRLGGRRGGGERPSECMQPPASPAPPPLCFRCGGPWPRSSSSSACRSSAICSSSASSCCAGRRSGGLTPKKPGAAPGNDAGGGGPGGGGEQRGGRVGEPGAAGAGGGDQGAGACEPDVSGPDGGTDGPPLPPAPRRHRS